MLYWIAGIVFALFVGMLIMFILTRKEIEMMKYRIEKSNKIIKHHKKILEYVQKYM